MARKSSSLFSMAILGIGGYFVYQNWPQISAWFASVATPAAAPAATVPAAAGTVVSASTTAAPSTASPAPVVNAPTQPSVTPSNSLLLPPYMQIVTVPASDVPGAAAASTPQTAGTLVYMARPGLPAYIFTRMAPPLAPATGQ